MQRQSLSPAAGPDPLADTTDIATPGDLICPASDIFDLSAITAALDSAMAECSSARDMRAATVEHLKAAYEAGRETLTQAFASEPMAGYPLTRSYTYLTDGLVHATLHVARTHLHPLSNPTESERLALMAVGGYGRGEMAPFSDVDLLFLTPYKITPWAESVIESMLYILLWPRSWTAACGMSSLPGPHATLSRPSSKNAKNG